eukprot:scaffold382_cov380-Prasinococcus_capsulatus_cf.AAC.38
MALPMRTNTSSCSEGGTSYIRRESGCKLRSRRKVRGASGAPYVLGCNRFARRPRGSSRLVAALQDPRSELSQVCGGRRRRLTYRPCSRLAPGQERSRVAVLLGHNLGLSTQGAGGSGHAPETVLLHLTARRGTSSNLGAEAVAVGGGEGVLVDGDVRRGPAAVQAVLVRVHLILLQLEAPLAVRLMAVPLPVLRRAVEERLHRAALVGRRAARPPDLLPGHPPPPHPRMPCGAAGWTDVGEEQRRAPGREGGAVRTGGDVLHRALLGRLGQAGLAAGNAVLVHRAAHLVVLAALARFHEACGRDHRLHSHGIARRNRVLLREERTGSTTAA